MDRVFLDANVLFSAAYRVDADMRRLWDVADAKLLTSSYAVEEARRNLNTPDQRQRLDELLASVSIVAEPVDRPLPAGVELPAKDKPILLAALDAGATYLLTGDVKHFGAYYGKTVQGVIILPPADYPPARGEHLGGRKKRGARKRNKQ